MKGQISLEYRASCGKCGLLEPIGGVEKKLLAQRRLRTAGWIHSGKLGWVCPRCKGKSRQEVDIEKGV